MWKGRFQQETAAAVQRFTESISFDWRLYKFDIQGSIAHALALERAGLLAPEERQQIESGLKAIEQEIDEGRFPFQIDLEDVHMNIESALTTRIGAAGGKLGQQRSDFGTDDPDGLARRRLCRCRQRSVGPSRPRVVQRRCI